MNKDARTVDQILNEWGSESEPISEEALFDVQSADEWGPKIHAGLKTAGIPFINIVKSTLGGPQRVALMIKLSLDKKENWANGIFENSRFAHLSLSSTGELEMFTRGRAMNNLRKTQVKTPGEAVKKIAAWAKVADSYKPVS